MDWTPQGVADRLGALREDWSACERCPLSECRQNIVFGRGNPQATIMLIGEAPGEEEDKVGEPFRGVSGEFLDELLEVADLDEEDLYITNIVMCRPPENRNPTKEEKEACLERLYEQIRLVDPLLIIPVGKTAMSFLMKGDWKAIQAQAGDIGFITIPGRYRPIQYQAMPILHPAFILRDDSVDPDIRTFKENGSAESTAIHLALARSIVDLMVDKYREQTATLKGHPALKVIQ